MGAPKQCSLARSQSTKRVNTGSEDDYSCTGRMLNLSALRWKQFASFNNRWLVTDFKIGNCWREIKGSGKKFHCEGTGTNRIR